MTEAATAQPNRPKPVSWRGLAVHACLITGALVMIYPLLWLASSSVKPSNLIFSDLSLWPARFRLQNYIDGWRGAALPFSTFFLNSFIISCLAVVGNVMACSMVAYAFARLNFAFKKTLFALMMLTIMIPLHATLIPQYALFYSLGWVNTFLPLVVPKFLAVDAFFIFLMVQFIRGIPRELDEAATVDGAGPIRIYWSVILPLLTPALVTTAVFSFIWTYEDFLSPLVYLTSMDKYTVPQGLSLLMSSKGASSWGPLLAMSLLSLVPLFLVFFIFQRRLIEGIAATGLKG
ncbi:MAG: carbohydrate ABC transporter permease [Chelatococcus sp.]|jgi:multiple sugar transport system permease protein|uniref:carbohydrate ABC transporter permease n=1 Tax=unclassified Chelatococcus TaxID=2638111 RepID=UPI001BD0832E|nr:MULTISPECIES: carbohydrate ABC transporter permease [unclassified Chelatococcus]CAH1649008.1 putative ABC transporter permease protein YesQ [Hyphomicrobiales bacterium]MBS7741826.1 carbohydrate ABC transporter permease [Chelatococcus sp. HY11]MBX3538004.1 carbohydrate ABC transporter permease [Chelatococcus sp.]MBX3541376.1 carbohydrate ABC transporter permease [Chelatococcus sp.]MCO5074730.1 carbohydrate ABC transporter permease [Chelatococcus sp.]